MKRLRQILVYILSAVFLWPLFFYAWVTTLFGKAPNYPRAIDEYAVFCAAFVFLAYATTAISVWFYFDFFGTL